MYTCHVHLLGHGVCTAGLALYTLDQPSNILAIKFSLVWSEEVHTGQ
jgi:hypothetical protein